MHEYQLVVDWPRELVCLPIPDLLSLLTTMGYLPLASLVRMLQYAVKVTRVQPSSSLTLCISPVQALRYNIEVTPKTSST